MILVDTSVWIDHLRQGDPSLVTVLEAGRVLMHPFVVGEVACGNLNRRAEVLMLLRELPPAPFATDDEALEFIERRGLMGRGIGYVDAHLVVATLLTAGSRLWTRDSKLAAVAQDLRVAMR